MGGRVWEMGGRGGGAWKVVDENGGMRNGIMGGRRWDSCEMGDGGWKMRDGRWKTGDGRGKR